MLFKMALTQCLQTELCITIRPDGDWIALNGIDYGVGIPEDHFQKLGEPFYSNNDKGFGLGLMLTYKIIERQHGKISIPSKVKLDWAHR
ncbi:ATP-binding protein [Paenisporosarcina macmurdoensis]|uniref:histidine kinase n=1 Tax=Paenisporosarcina macmurdoensis TaxID=212659 RepID=A0ABW1LAV1_9BACL